MNIFITVGTTRFTELIREIDSFYKLDECKKINFFCQNSDDTYLPEMPNKNFIENIEDYYQWADLVITHAGAGSIYRLLEMEKKIIIVPNLSRVDKHQSDIAKFMEEGRYALVVWDLNLLSETILLSNRFIPKKYHVDKFFKAKEIVNFIDSVCF